MNKIIESEGLYTNFYTFEGVVKALNGVNMIVNAGETYGIVGETGCGKSVTVRSMMRIVQQPGSIDGGKIVLFRDKANQAHGIDILKRSEAFMRAMRGNDVSMIFQEASTSLNPVLTAGDQVGESFFFHRLDEVLSKCIDRIDTELESDHNVLRRVWRRFQRALFRRERAKIEHYEHEVAEIENELMALEDKTDSASGRWRTFLNLRRDSLRKTDLLVQLVKRVPFLNAYYRRVRKQIRASVIELFTQLGIPNPANVFDRYPHELSGGMQQRIVIAIALSCNPTLLIADEPTSNLDVTIQAQIIELIRTLKQASIASVLFITHDLGIVAEICDRATVMYAGDVAETATVRELFHNPLHPYSRGLLAAVPGVDQEGELTTIPGNVPNLVHPPTGCRFHPRCPHAMDICAREKPETIEENPGHFVACHLYTGKGAT